MKVLTIGKSTNVNHRINDARVSGIHAKLTLHSPDNIVVEDNQSTNGTYVNGQQIFRTTISVNDTLVLIKPTVAEGGILVNLKQFFVAPPPPQTPQQQQQQQQPVVVSGFEHTLPEVKRIYNQFKVDKDAVTKGHTTKVNLLRGGMIIVPSAISLLVTENRMYAGLITAGSSALAMMVTGSMTPKDDLDALQTQFQINYTCKVAGCTRGFLGFTDPAVWEAAKRCPCTRCTW